MTYREIESELRRRGDRYLADQLRREIPDLLRDSHAERWSLWPDVIDRETRSAAADILRDHGD